jgi:hypothetical protein
MSDEIPPKPGLWVAEWTDHYGNTDRTVVQVGSPEDAYPGPDEYMSLGTEIVEKVSDPHIKFIKHFTIEEILGER